MGVQPVLGRHDLVEDGLNLCGSVAAGKAGARAFANSLALELRPWPHIQVCSVFPTFVNTPGVQHAANYSGRAVRPTVFATPPETVAATIVELCSFRNKRLLLGSRQFGRQSPSVLPRPS